MWLARRGVGSKFHTACFRLSNHQCSTSFTPEDPFIRNLIQVNAAKNANPIISVMTYNILAQSNVIDDGQYGYTPKWALELPYRMRNLFTELTTYLPDIICLQESDQSEEIKSVMSKHGYSSEFFQRGGKFLDGCQCLYQQSKFELIHVENIRLNQLVSECVVNKREFRKWNVAQLLIFQALETPNKQLFCVGNTHLHWDPSLEHVKVAQAHYVMHQIDELKSKFRVDFPIILCGDFNSKPNSRVYELIRDGICKDRGKKKDILLHTHGTPLRSAYECINDPPTNFASSFVGTLDYIFYSKNIHVLGLLDELRKDSPPLLKYTALPNPMQPSDHIPLAIVFQFK